MKRERTTITLNGARGVLIAFAVGAAAGLFGGLFAHHNEPTRPSAWIVALLSVSTGLAVALVACVLLLIDKARAKRRPPSWLETATESPAFIGTQIGTGLMSQLVADDPSATQPTPLGDEDMTFRAVFEEIQRLADSKAGWTSGILTLVVTVVIFSALAMSQGGWAPLAMLVGVLFLHELGHLAAMRLFGYRNLRMFFIPLFGAAVTGRHYNIAGWKKAVVALMGPLPGILLGAGLVVVAWFCRSLMLVDAALLLVLVNAFNLLPLLPLDGGRMMETVLFSRHPLLDTVIRALTAGLLMLSWFIGLKVLAVVGLFMLFALPTTYRMGQVVRRLRKSGFDATSGDAVTIPVHAARAIHQEIQQVFPSPLNQKTSARLTLSAFEALNARPPRVLASFMLIGAQGLTLFVALAAAVVLVPGQMILRPTQAIQHNPQDADAFVSRARAYRLFTRYEDAVSDYTRAIDLGVCNAETLYGRGDAYHNLGRQQEAIRDLTRAIELDPKNALAFRSRGAAYAALDKKSQAQADLRKALDLQPMLRYSIQRISERYGLEP
ncbi:MAG: tetratricopeptide repeat protein [Thermoguttaceae bacterium]